MSSDSTVLIGGQLKRWRLVMVVIAVLGYGLDQWAKVEAVAHLDPLQPAELVRWFDHTAPVAQSWGGLFDGLNGHCVDQPLCGRHARCRMCMGSAPSSSSLVSYCLRHAHCWDLRQPD